jgi:PIN domain nuclease of toxin-antitoxin system
LASRYLLDTHTWFWLAAGEARAPAAVLAELEAALVDGRLFLSRISTWEIAHKVSVGKIDIARPLDVWLRETTTGIEMVDLSLEVVVESTRLPGSFHKDPADRFIVASARVHDLALVTGDRLILDYAAGGYVRVIGI